MTADGIEPSEREQKQVQGPPPTGPLALFGPQTYFQNLLSRRWRHTRP